MVAGVHLTSLDIPHYSIYIRPFYTRVRKAYPEMSRWWALKLCLVETDLPTLQQTQELYSQKNSASSPHDSARTGPAVQIPTKLSKSSKSVEVLESILEESDDEDDRMGGLFGSKKHLTPLATRKMRVAMDGTLARIPAEKSRESLANDE